MVLWLVGKRVPPSQSIVGPTLAIGSMWKFSILRSHSWVLGIWILTEITKKYRY